MTNVKFGTNQLGNPTPSRIGMGLDIFTGVAGCVIAWLTTAAFIPSTVSNVLSSILGLLIGISQVIKPFFGVQTTRKNVSVDDVTEMKES